MTTRFDPAAPVVVDPPAIVRADTSRAETVNERLLELERVSTDAWYEQAELWAEAIDGDYHHADHCESLKDFVTKHNIELSLREIQYRAKISRVSKKLEIKRDQLKKAGISKIKAIFELDPGVEYTDPVTGNTAPMGQKMRSLVIEAGAGTSLKSIREKVKTLRGDDPTEVIYETVAYTKAQKEIVDLAAEVVIAQSGDTVNPDTGEVKEVSRATVYERLAAEFLADPNNNLDEDGAAPTGSFEDEHYVRTDDGVDYETGH